jgi:hypothetical protein
MSQLIAAERYDLDDEHLDIPVATSHAELVEK